MKIEGKKIPMQKIKSMTKKFIKKQCRKIMMMMKKNMRKKKRLMMSKLGRI